MDGGEIIIKIDRKDSGVLQAIELKNLTSVEAIAFLDVAKHNIINKATAEVRSEDGSSTFLRFKDKLKDNDLDSEEID